MQSNDTRPDSATDLTTNSQPLGLVWVHPTVAFTPLLKPRVTLGRGEEADVTLPGERVSRIHARVTRSGPLAVVSDAGSRNGVFHNGVRVNEAPLADNDVLRVGDHLAVVIRVPGDFSNSDPLFDEPLADTLIGPRSRAGWRQLVQLSTLSASVIVEGPTGTGKEVYARALHVLSGREGEFVALNCAAIPEGLAESQLFGLARGSFTGALRSLPGLFEAATGGTFLLDEVVDLSLALQAKLLRAIEESAVTRVGETSPRPVNFRLVVASQKPLFQLVEAGLFRADLLARLAGGTLRLPPLRERREEVWLLFKKFFSKAGGDPALLSASFCEAVCLQDWPLNTRQLVQVAAHGALTRPAGSRFRHSDLGVMLESVYGNQQASPSLVEGEPIPHHTAAARLGVRRAMWFQRHQEELDALLAAMKENGGNISRAAKTIGISRQRASRLLSARSTLRGAADQLRLGQE